MMSNERDEKRIPPDVSALAKMMAIIDIAIKDGEENLDIARIGIDFDDEERAYIENLLKDVGDE